MSTFSGLYIAVSGMSANKAALDTAAHNMANVNIAGYTRQEVVMTAGIPCQSTNFNGLVGSGVTVQGVRRITDSYLESRIQREQASADCWSAQYDILQKIESNINTLDLPGAFSSFWSAWHDASLSTDQELERFNLVEQAKSLVSSLKSAGTQLEEIEKEINNEIADKMIQVNNLGEQIAALNKQITQTLDMGQQPNDLLDKRDSLIRDFVGITGADVTYNSDSTVSITLAVKASSTEPAVDVDIVNGSNFTKIPEGAVLEVTNGSLFGLMTVRDDQLQSYKGFLDELAVSVATEVNQLHFAGYTVDGKTEISFFTEPVTGVADLDLSAEVKADPNNIAVNGPTSADTGTVALNISNLGTHLPKGISDFLGKIGAGVASAEFQATSHEDMINEMDNLRASISGVSIDEEMAKVIQFQRSYQASAQVFSVMDSMLETLINMVR